MKRTPEPYRLPGLDKPLRTYPEWSIGNAEAGFEGVFAVLPGKILFSSFKGYANTTHIRDALTILNGILATENTLEDRSFARISDFSGLRGISWQARNVYVQGIRDAYQKSGIRPALTYLCGKKSMVLDLVTVKGEDMGKGVATAETVGDAINSALGVMKIERASRKKEKKLTIEKSKIDRLVEFVGRPSTDPEGMLMPRLDDDDPLESVYESVIRLKSDAIQQNMVLALRFHELANARTELKKKTDELTLLSDSIDTQIWHLKKPGTYGAVNNAHADFLGLPKKSIEYRPVKEVVGVSALGAWIEGNEEVFSKGEIFSADRVIENAGNQKRHLTITKFPKLSADGKVEYVVCQAVDNTEANLVLEKLKEAKAAAEEATRAKREFFANMNHEIRTPLNGIIGVVDILSGLPASEEQKRYLKILAIEARSMHELVNGILDYSKIEAGRMEIECIPFDLKRIASELTDSMSLRAANSGIELLTEISPLLPEMVEGDPTRLRQALTNIIGNAIKFTHEGHVLLRIYPSGDKVRFEVSDTGVGIPEDKLHLVFSEFAQVDGSTARRYGGTGLGGTIAKNLINLMGSEIFLESRVGVGTTVSFELSLPGASSGKKEVSHSRAARRLKGRALIVDDNETNLKILANLLNRIGLMAATAPSGEAALEIHTPGAFDIVYMDIKMPGMDGYEAAVKIREAEKAAKAGRVPIIALSASKAAGEEEKAAKAGMDGFITKPIRQVDLVDNLTKWLKKNKPGALQARPAGPGKPKALLPVDIGELAAEIDNPELALTIAREFAARLPGEISGMRLALEKGDWSALSGLAHKIKGGAANIRAVGAALAAGALEKSAREQKRALAEKNLALLETEALNIMKYLDKPA